MTTRDDIEALGMSPKDLRPKFETEKKSKKIQKFIDLCGDRVREGRNQNLSDYRLWWAMDTAYDVPMKQTTLSMLGTFLERVAKGDIRGKAVLKAARDDWGLGEFIRSGCNANGEKEDKIEWPVFFNVHIPIARAYLNIRWAKIVSDYDLYPFLKYEPIKYTSKNRVKCEIITDAVEFIGQQLGYRATFKQWLFHSLHYGIGMMFPMEDWYREHGAKAVQKGKKNKFETQYYVKRQGLRYAIPHPSRVFYDQMFRVGTINSDTGVRYAGYWKIARYGDVKDSKAYWNTDKISMMSHDLIAANSVFFNLYPCTMSFPTAGTNSTSTRGAGKLDREASATFYTSNETDRAVVLTELFCKAIPDEYDLGASKAPMWFRVLMANDTDVIYCAPLLYTPPLYIGYDPHEERRRNCSLTMEILPFQDHISNLVSQQILTAKQNLLRVSFANTDLIPKQYLDQVQNMGEDLYRSLIVIPFSGRKTQMGLSSIKEAFVNMAFPPASTVELVSTIRTLLDLLERVLVYSAQEVGAVAAHEQTAEETRIVAGSVNNRLALTESFVADGVYAWKKQLYDALMAYGDKTIYAQVPTVEKVTDKVLKDLGFTIDEAGIPGQSNIQVHGPRSALALEGFTSSRETNNRIDNPAIAAAISQIMQILMANELTAMAIGPEQAINVFNEVARIAGMPRDFKLHVANREFVDRMMGKQGDEQQQQAMGEMQQQFQKLAEEILTASGEQTKQIVTEAVEPIAEQHRELASEIKFNANEQKRTAKVADHNSKSIDEILTRLRDILASQSDREAQPGPSKR